MQIFVSPDASPKYHAVNEQIRKFFAGTLNLLHENAALGNERKIGRLDSVC